MKKTLAALALLPLVAGALWALLGPIGALLRSAETTWPFLIGAAAYLPFGLASRGSGRAYILAHELSHAAAAALCGIKVGRISVGRNAGHVKLAGSNAFVDLAPYFVPLYAAAAALAYGLALYFVDLRPYRAWFTALTGFLLSFHLLNTAAVMAGPVQSDFRKAGGVFFSFSMVLLANAFFLALCLKALYPAAFPLKGYFADALGRAAAIANGLWQLLEAAVNTAKIYAG
ncbi:MAG: hypothetical protein FD189_693 [Elusimicrobia bacterium]|nr:MAG: hypothetical protein FD154_1316 [Elusimicrobiota bacterium]KAF0157124.1 MAG: hypothetical protein FD189_693 [Elusimicrobiota bacterium]